MIISLFSVALIVISSIAIIICINELSIESSNKIKTIKMSIFLFFKDKESVLTDFQKYCIEQNNTGKKDGQALYWFLFEKYYNGKLLFDQNEYRNKILTYLSLLATFISIFLGLNNGLCIWLVVGACAAVVTFAIACAICRKKEVETLSKIYEEQYIEIQKLYQEFSHIDGENNEIV